MTPDKKQATFEGYYDPPIIEPRGSVQWFAWHMEIKLRAKDYRPGWHDMTDADLFAWMQDEMRELLHAMASGISEDIIDEAVDVANLAHMVAENAERRRAR